MTDERLKGIINKEIGIALRKQRERKARNFAAFSAPMRFPSAAMCFAQGRAWAKSKDAA